jgi:hypothetical protein
LREAEVALAQVRTTKDVCRQLEVIEQTYYRWRNEYGGLKVDEAKRLRDLERENESSSLRANTGATATDESRR